MPQYSDLLNITTYTQEQRGESQTRKDKSKIKKRKTEIFLTDITVFTYESHISERVENMDFS